MILGARPTLKKKIYQNPWTYNEFFNGYQIRETKSNTRKSSKSVYLPNTVQSPKVSKRPTSNNQQQSITKNKNTRPKNSHPII